MCRIAKYELVCEKVATYEADINTRFKAEDSTMQAVRSAHDVFRLLRDTVRTDRFTTEHFFVFCLDTKLKIIGFFDIASGGLDAAPVHPREVFQPAVAMPKCAAIIVAHNHPSGDPAPSAEDLEVTRRLVDAGKLLGIRVMDHIVIGDGCYESIRSMGDIEF